MSGWVSPEVSRQLLEAWPLDVFATFVVALTSSAYFVLYLLILCVAPVQEERGLGDLHLEKDAVGCLGFLGLVLIGGALGVDALLARFEWRIAGAFTGYALVQAVFVILLLVLVFPLRPLTRSLPDRLVIGVASLWIAVASGGLWGVVRLHVAEHVERPRLELRATEPLRKVRRTQPMQLPLGTAMDQRGSLVGWVAAPPGVRVDQAHERSLGAGARRVVPIVVVLLNNSFRDLELAPGDGLAWRLQLTRAGAPVKEWIERATPEGFVLGPAERLEWRVDWDGRDPAGSLCGPGEYQVRLSTPAIAGANTGLAVVTTLQIQEVGPVVELIRDPTQVVLDGLRQSDRDHRRNQGAIQSESRYRGFQMERQRLQWQQHRSNLPFWMGS